MVALPRRELQDSHAMSSYPRSPKEMTRGMMYFPRMLDKIRLHARGELGEDYLPNLGSRKAADGVCCGFLHLDYAKAARTRAAGRNRRRDSGLVFRERSPAERGGPFRLERVRDKTRLE